MLIYRVSPKLFLPLAFFFLPEYDVKEKPFPPKCKQRKKEVRKVTISILKLSYKNYRMFSPKNDSKAYPIKLSDLTKI